MKAGILLDNFFGHLPRKDAFRAAARAGFQGVQFYVTSDLSPRELGKTARKDLRAFIASLGLRAPAVCADFGKGFASPRYVEWSAERVAECIPLAADLGIPVLSTHIGKIPEDPSDPVYPMMQEVLNDLGARAEAVGCVIAVETGPDAPSHLKRFLEDTANPGLAVNLDPSNLVRRGFDPVKAVYDLAPFIRHTHAKDGIRGDGEARLGEGDVPWKDYSAALKDIGYEGFLTAERERLNAPPEEEAAFALEFIRRLL